MKKGWIIVIVVLVLLFFMGCNTYNNLVKQEELVSEKWSQVENVYQRRADLIPNLVETVKGYANFEKETLTQVIEARAKATAVNINPNNLTPESLQQFQQAQEGLSSALSRLMVVVEKYPELKANANFMDLQAQLEGSENRIATERRTFNEAVRTYNTYLRRFPSNLFAGIFGFEKKGYFEAQEGAEKPPQVKF